MSSSSPFRRRGRRGLRGRALRVAVALAAASALPGAAAAQTVYLAFGDSITAGVGDDPSRAEKGYPPRLEALLVDSGRNAVVENHGVPGERTASGLSRIDQVLAGGGDVLLLMEGTNDIQSGISPETSRFNLNQMAERARAAGVTVIHATVIPRRTGPEELLSNNQHFVMLLRDLAGTRGRALADPFEVFINTRNVIQCCYADLEGDRVGHPNAEGYDLLAGVFFDHIRGVDRVPPVPSRMEPAPGAELADAPDEIVLEVRDFGAGIDLSALDLLVNGSVASATLVGEPNHATLRVAPSASLSGVVTVGLRARDRASPANSVNREVGSFSVGALVTAGDIDGSGRIDGADLVRLALAFGSARGGPRYDAAADLDGTGTVNGNDLAILAAGFGRSVQ